MRRLFMASVAVPFGLALAASPVSARDCEDLVPPARVDASKTRPIAAADLIQLRDIGAFSAIDPSAGVFSLSPDGSKLAFQMRRANIATNGYCMGLLVLPVNGEGDAKLLDAGGAFIRQVYSSNGFAAHVSPGTPKTLVPKWSPDGRWIAYLRRDAGVTQLWRAAADGGDTVPLTAGASDIENFAWAPDGEALVYVTRPGLRAAEAAIVKEGQQGWLYDDRFEPISGNQPMPREPVENRYFTIGMDGRAPTPVSPDQGRALLEGDDKCRPAGAQVYAVGKIGSVAWTMAADATNVMSPTVLHLKRTGNAEETCNQPACVGIASLWWSQDGRDLIYLRREGWRKSQTGFYIWRADEAAPRQVLLTEDVLIGCEPDMARIICGYEGSLAPRRLVSVDLSTGVVTPLFDPNPEFTQVKLGSAIRLKWTNAFGIDTFGDLVLPPDHVTGQVHPLVVIMYDSRGFLRGSTGDEYPVQLLAARGFAVLSVQNPVSITATRGAASYEEVARRDRVNWADRRSILSSIEVGVKRAVDLGVADPKRLGIAGLSDGATSVQFALLNSHLFRAAAMSSCCDDVPAASWLDGPAGTSWLHGMGYPSVAHPDPAFWADMSLHAYADRVEAPVLIQTPDREYLGALEGVTALKELGKPVELYVFPDEYHVKWQPAHRAAVYARVVDWFDFWLNNRERPGADTQDQYRRWRDLRAAQSSGAAPGK